MRNQDTTPDFQTRINNALENQDMPALAAAIVDWQRGVEDNILNEARELVGVTDRNILAQRGIRQLTSDENAYYNAVIEYVRGNATGRQNAITNIDVAMPTTIIDQVFVDLVGQHPLLEAVRFQNISGMAEIILNTNTKQMATWGTLTSAITKELSGGLTKIKLGQKKLSAFMLIPQSIIDLGPSWLDRYVRDVLLDALSYGLEDGIIKGTGNNQPIGMIREVGTGENRTTGITLTDGEFPEKTPVVITDLSPKTYGELISGLAKAPNGNTRAINSIIMIVNPVDYFKTIVPATTVLRPDGTYANNVLPYPTKIIQSASVDEGKAVFGLADRYFMGLGTPKNGKIEYSDEYKFIEDERTYRIKFYGEGQPMDNNSFVYADISAVEPISPIVFNVSSTTTTTTTGGESA